MSAILISEQEAREIIDALEYAYDCAENEARSEMVVGARVQTEDYMLAERRMKQCARHLVDIKRRVKK